MKKKRRPKIQFPLNDTSGSAKLGYPPDEDIFIRSEKFLFTEEASEANLDFLETGTDHDDREGPSTGEDLDVPGAELDDAAEDIGAEDEENNYYSLGGENHQDLEDNP